jgi:SAM-dependent methyltransferase
MTESIAFDRAAGYYDATRGFPPGVESDVADLFVAVGGLAPTSRVLEVGIGTGRIARPLAERTGRVVGADLSAPMLAKLVAQRGGRRIDVARADVTRLPFSGRVFDAAIAVHVFHLIPGWRDTLAEIARVLRAGAPLLHGADDHSRGEAWARWRDRLDAVQGVENVGVARAKLGVFLDEAGWRRIAEREVTFARRLRPAVLLDLVARRAWSMTWRMSDEQLDAAVASLRADLEDRFGDLEREVEVETGFWVRAYLPPA